MAHDVNISDIDAALAFTRGNFVAAAKLMDLTPAQLKSIVQYRPALEKWRKKSRGRPADRLGFTSTEPAAVEFKVVNGAIWEGHFQRNLNAAADEGWKLVESNTFTDRHAYAVMSRPKK